MMSSSRLPLLAGNSSFSNEEIVEMPESRLDGRRVPSDEDSVPDEKKDKLFTAVVRPRSSETSSSSSTRRSLTRRRTSSSLLPESVAHYLPLQIALGTLCIVMGTAQVVSIPIYDQIINGHSDFYVVTLLTGFWFSVLTFGTWIFARLLTKREIFFTPQTQWSLLLYLGINYGMQNIMQLYAGLPARTPKYLQPILSSLGIPFTCLFRWIIIKKSVTPRQLTCVFVVMVGLFVAVSPSIFGLPERQSDAADADIVPTTPRGYDADGDLGVIEATGSDAGSGNVTSGSHVGGGGSVGKRDNFGGGYNGSSGGGVEARDWTALWPVVYALSFIPFSVNNVIFEQQIKLFPDELLLVYSWSQFIGFVTVAALFWTDVIPSLGNANSIWRLGHHIREGMLCHYGDKPDCHALPISVVFVIGYLGYDVFAFMLMSVSESAIYVVIVEALVTPISGVFWFLFDYTKNNTLIFSPFWSISSLFPFLGFALILPANILYNASTSKDDEKSARERKKMEKSRNNNNENSVDAGGGGGGGSGGGGSRGGGTEDEGGGRGSTIGDFTYNPNNAEKTGEITTAEERDVEVDAETFSSLDVMSSAAKKKEKGDTSEESHRHRNRGGKPSEDGEDAEEAKEEDDEEEGEYGEMIPLRTRHEFK